MENKRVGMVVGGGLVVVGLLFLLQNFGLLGGLDNLIWLVLFGAGGLIFLYVFAADREQWWAVIPGFTLLGLAALIGFGDRLGALGGALFLGAIGLSFWVIYFLRRDFWWAVIPGGVLVSLALVAAVSESLPGLATGGVFFLGLAVTFLLVYLLPTAGGRMSWAIIPAGILGAMGAALMLSLGGVINYVWAVALILGGAYLLFRATLVHKR